MNGSGNGNGCGSRDNEIVRVQGRDFPVIGGKLRIVHEVNKEKLSIGTELVDYIIDQHAVVRATVIIAVGTFTATGPSSAARDPKLADSLIELTETRAIARALRLAGVGVETVGFEELGAGPVFEGTAPRQTADGNQDGRVQNGNRGNGNGSGGHRAPATAAQVRCIRHLAHQKGQEADDLIEKILPVATLVEVVRRSLEQNQVIPIRYGEKESPDTMLEQARVMLEAWTTWDRPKATILAAEHEFRLPIADWLPPLVGRVDVVELQDDTRRVPCVSGADGCSPHIRLPTVARRLPWTDQGH